MARCEGGCGRPLRVDGVLTEALKSREIECGGCDEERRAEATRLSDERDAVVALNAENEAWNIEERKKSADQQHIRAPTVVPDDATFPALALQSSRNAHYAREQAAGEAERRVWLARNAQGLHAKRDENLEDFTDANGKTVTVAEMKARAQAKLDAMGG